MFIYHYFDYYHKGKKDASYRELYNELDKFARSTIALFVMFLLLTYLAHNFDGFWGIIIKGGVLTAIVLPPLYTYYSDETRFIF